MDTWSAEFSSLVGSLGAIAVVFFIYKATSDGRKIARENPGSGRSWDLFEIGEVYDKPYYSPSPTNIMREVDSIPTAPIKSPIFDDCVMALVGLGHKKSDSKKAVAAHFEHSNPSTVEEFLGEFYQKG